MSGVATAIAGGAILGAVASNSAANKQSRSANKAANLQQQQFEQQREDQTPWREAGQTALNALVPLATDYKPFNADMMYKDPGYQFRLSEGLKALDRQAAARGGLISGAALKAAGRYGQDYASNEYTNAFNRYQTERNARLNPLQSLAGLGQTATNQLASASQNYANNAGEAYMNAGNARASGYVGSANALTNALGTGLNYYQNRQYMNMLGGGGGGAWGGYSAGSSPGTMTDSSGYILNMPGG